MATLASFRPPRPPAPAPPLVLLEDVAKIYRVGDVDVPALGGVSLSLAAGERVAIIGPSGSGKSTLMNIIGCLDRPSAGRYLLGGVDVSRLDVNRRAEVRSTVIGFVFQSFNLLARSTALENVELPLVYAGIPRRERRARAQRALERVGLDSRLDHRPSQLSGGQQQRVAVARALVTRPRLILADEPTGNLDSRASAEVMALLEELSDAGITVVLVTHDPEIAAHAERVITVRDGAVVADSRQAPRRAPRARPAPVPTATPALADTAEEGWAP